jgi:hypothetical protein
MPGGLACSSGVKSSACSPPSPCYCLRRNIATLRRHLTNQPQQHQQARQPKKPCRTNSATAAMTAINTSFLNVSGAILSRICCPTHTPSTTGNIAAVDTETSSQLNSRLAVRRIASKPEETTRNSDASFVNAFPRSPFASRNMKTSCDATQSPAEKSECDARWQKQARLKRQLRSEQCDAANTHKHYACDSPCSVRIDRQQDSNSKEEAGDHAEKHRDQLHEALPGLSADDPGSAVVSASGTSRAARDGGYRITPTVASAGPRALPSYTEADICQDPITDGPLCRRSCPLHGAQRSGLAPTRFTSSTRRCKESGDANPPLSVSLLETAKRAPPANSTSGLRTTTSGRRIADRRILTRPAVRHLGVVDTPCATRHRPQGKRWGEHGRMLAGKAAAATASELASARGYLRRISSIALPLASSSMSLSR